MKRIVCLLTLAGALAAPAGASADIDVTGAKGVQVGLAAAAAYWHRMPAQCSKITVLGAFNDSDMAGWTYMPAAVAASGGAIPACTVWVNFTYLRFVGKWIGPEYRRSETCRIVVHEVGHKLGHAHAEYADDPERVMLNEMPGVCS